MAAGTLRPNRSPLPSAGSASPSNLLHSSLNAPNRSRSITIDDYIDGQNPPPQNNPLRLPICDDQGSSSSDSDDDENDNLRNRNDTMLGRSKRSGEGTQRLGKRSASALSLESLQNSDGGESQDVKVRIVGGKQGVGSKENGPDVTPSFNQKGRGQEADVKKSKLGEDVLELGPNADEVPGAASIPAEVMRDGVGSYNQSKNGFCGKCGGGGAADQANNCGRCTCENGSGGKLNGSEPGRNPPADSVQNDKQVVTTKGENGTNSIEGKRFLVNIETVPADDGSGWDRFIFFSFRGQRFDFTSKTYLSSYSPFAAVASGMEGVTSKSVCAVCGSGGDLVSCRRCPLAFHAPCVNPKNPQAYEPFFCIACKAVKGHDETASWDPITQPPALPSPASGFARLIADARDGNPIDLVFNPTLFSYYRNQCGGDWLRCRICQQIRVADDGVLTECVRVPFECTFTFWARDRPKQCSHRSSQRQSDIIKSIEKYISTRSRRRNALFFSEFGEENRTDYGFPEVEAEDEAENEVIVIDDGDSDVAEAKTGASVSEEQPVSEVINESQLVTPKAQEQVVTKRPGRMTPPNITTGIGLHKDAFGQKHDISEGLNSAVTYLKQDKANYVNGSNGNDLEVSNNHVQLRNEKEDGSLQTSGTGQFSNRAHLHEQNSTKIPQTGDNRKSKKQMAVSQKVAGDETAIAEAATKLTPAMTRDDDVVIVSESQEENATEPMKEERRKAADEVRHEDEATDKPVQRNSGSSSGDIQENLLEYIASLEFPANVEDILTDMALENNASLNKLYVAFHRNDNKFKRHATRFANRLMGNDTSTVRF